MEREPNINLLYENIRIVLLEARQGAYRAVHFYMVRAYWDTGRLIVEEEQAGKERADYGTQIIKSLAKKLVNDFDETYDERNLYYFRQFYQVFPNLNALRSELSWTHYRSLIRVQNEAARSWYMAEAANEQWGTRALDRQIKALYFERLALSADKRAVREEAESKIRDLPAGPAEFVKDPYVLEFLNLKPNHKLYEKDETVVRYSVLDESKQLFAARYLLYLPTEAELAEKVREEVAHFRLLSGMEED